LRVKNKIYLKACLLLLPIFFTDCTSPYSLFLRDPDYKGKSLVANQRIVGNKGLSTYDLEALELQKENRTILSWRMWMHFHYIGKRVFDSARADKRFQQKLTHVDKRLAKPDIKDSKKNKLENKKNQIEEKQEIVRKEGNWMMRSVGEAPIVLDSVAAQETLKRIERYAFAHGYFDRKASLQIKYVGRSARIEYQIEEGPLSTLGEINYKCTDSTIYNLINKNIPKVALTQTGQPYLESAISSERDRLHNLLKQNGYFDFNRRYIFVNVDTNHLSKKVNLEYNIEMPETGYHRIYRLQSVAFYGDLPNNFPKGQLTPETYSNIRYLKRKNLTEKRVITYYFNEDRYSKRVLSHKINLFEDSIYNEQNVQDLQRQLGVTDMFKFVNVSFEKTSLDSMNGVLKASIYTAPLPKYQITQEYGLVVGQAYVPGPLLSLSLRDRNIFNGLEILELNARFSIEGQASASDPNLILNYREIGFNTSLIYPYLVLPGAWRHRFALQNPSTRFVIAYTNSNRPEYTRNAVTLSDIYFWQLTKKWRIRFSPIEVNLIQTEIKQQEFQDYLDDLQSQGNNLYLSFRNAIVTNLNVHFINSKNYGGDRPNGSFLKPSFEIGGIVPNMLSKYVTNEQDNELFGLTYYEYYKAALDYRKASVLSRRSSIAYKINAGYARPYGASGIKQGGQFVLPYEKYFFIGGANSIRAWQPRRLGPGSYYNNADPYKFEEPGEILFESSFEYRFNIYSFINGAAFLDAGNIWRINEPSRPGGDFKGFRSIPEIAVGTGVGLRLNFSFLIVRFDVGYKVYDPADKGTPKFVFFDYKSQSPTLNFSIGYPF
jgi:outer membrane protein insertion porin family